MVRVSCREFQEFINAVPAVRGRYLQTRRSERSWQLRVLPLGGDTVLMVRGGASDLFHGISLNDQYSIYIPLSDPSLVTSCGDALAPCVLGLLHAGQEVHLRTAAPTRWVGLHFKRSVLRHRLEHGIVESDVIPPAQVFQSSAPSLMALVRLVRRLFEVEGDDAEALHGNARVMAAHQLLEAIFHLRATSAADARAPRGRPPLQRHLVISRCLDLIDAQLTRQLSVDDLCAAAGVSDRTLRTVFLEQFGVSPHRYLMMRRMHAIHQALRNARGGETITSLCSDYGVWDFGRFARQYRQLYGVLPSQDLRAATQSKSNLAAMTQASHATTVDMGRRRKRKGNAHRDADNDGLTRQPARRGQHSQ